MSTRENLMETAVDLIQTVPENKLEQLISFIQFIRIPEDDFSDMVLANKKTLRELWDNEFDDRWDSV
jgi:hypothetical protein